MIQAGLGEYSSNIEDESAVPSVKMSIKIRGDMVHPHSHIA